MPIKIFLFFVLIVRIIQLIKMMAHTSLSDSDLCMKYIALDDPHIGQVIRETHDQIVVFGE